MKTHNTLHYFLSFLLLLSPVVTVCGASDRFGDSWPAIARSALTPIGNVESLEPIEINGQPAKRATVIWNGDIVQAAAGTTARVSIPALGEVLLRNNGAAKLAADEQTHNLYATVIKGEMSVALNPESSAKVEMGDASFVTTKGAKFRASLREGEPSVTLTTGEAINLGNWRLNFTAGVEEMPSQQAAPRRYLIKPYNLGASTDVRARSARNIQVRVTDENDKPIPDVPVLFFIGGAGGGAGSGAGSLAGQLSVKVTTNQQGVASVNFNASDAAGSTTKIKAQVEGSDAVWEGTLNVIAAKSGFWTPHNAVPVFAVIGAAVGFGLYKYVSRDTTVRSPQVITTRPNTTGIIP